MKHLLKILFVLIALGFSSHLVAQTELSVSGIVKDRDTGEALLGVTVQVQGTNLGTTTDFDGRYTLKNVKRGTILLFSYVGMKKVERTVNSSKLDVALEPDASGLDEVVVVGYGTARKRDVTGSIVSISSDQLKSSPDYNPIKSLQGKVAGLQVTNSGAAGGGAQIRLRGVATINASTNPLYVVDGMLMDNIDFLSTNDIVSVEVLKDPSSLAIFGVQGANGVIILTTSRAEKGKLTATYDGYAGAQIVHARDRVRLTNATQFTNLYNELLKNQNPNEELWQGDLLGKGTDWVDLVLRPAVITNHNVTISQASDKASSVFSGGYFLQDGVLRDNSYQRFNGRYSGDYNLTNHVKVGSTMNLSYWDMDPSAASIQNAVRAVPTYSPYAPPEDWNAQNPGSYYTPSPSLQKDVANPMAVYNLNKGTAESYGYRAVGSAYLEVDFLRDFKFRATGYADLGVSMGSDFSPKFDVNNASSSSSHKREYSSFSRNTAEYTKYQADYILNYNKTLNKHRIGATAGYTVRLQQDKGFSASADTIGGRDMNVVPEDFWMLSQGSAKTMRASDWFSEEAFVSYLARANYSYEDKYLLTATFRADGSSKFSPNKRWGYFPSLGAGWVVSEEKFMEDYRKNVNFLKIKASFGQLGNDKIGNYLYFPTINPTGQQVIIDGQVYYIPTVNNQVDEDIHWEIVTGFDFGLEGRFFNNRMGLDLGYYTKTTSDLLAYVAPSVSVGAGYAITNAGSMRNDGVEFMISWNDQINKDWRYGISVNGSTLRNKVLSLGNNNADIITGTYHRSSVGQPIGSFYGYVQDGVFQTQAEVDAYKSAIATSYDLKPGDIRYKDLNGDNKLTDKDREFIGSPLPQFIYGMTMNLGYKDFDLSVDFNGQWGNKILNAKKLVTFTQFNFYESTLDRWHGEGTSNVEPILDFTRAHNYLPSTNLLESGAYFRVRAIQLGYNLPKKATSKLGLSKLRFFANIQNPLTFRMNTGFTPEVGGAILGGGVDDGGTYPVPTTYTAGLTLNF